MVRKISLIRHQRFAFDLELARAVMNRFLIVVTPLVSVNLGQTMLYAALSTQNSRRVSRRNRHYPASLICGALKANGPCVPCGAIGIGAFVAPLGAAAEAIGACSVSTALITFAIAVRGLRITNLRPINP
jgi:hypothetical protein